MAKRRRVRAWVKAILILVPVIAGITCLIIFGFKLKDIDYKSDLNEFTKEDVKAYLDKNDINNAFTLWFRDLIGQDREIVLFEDYSVRLKSNSKVEIEAHEKQFMGYIKKDKLNYYFDEDGTLLKITDYKYKGVPKVKGIEIVKGDLYQKIKVSDKKQFKLVVRLAKAIAPYDFDVKKFLVNKNREVSVYIKKIQVDLGKADNLKKKLSDLNDMYEKVIKRKGILDMKKVNNEGKYIIKQSKNN